MRAAYGADVLERRERELRRDIARLRPAAAAPLRPHELTTAPAVTFFAERYRELLGGLLAIAVLRDGLGLQAGSFIAPAGAEFALDAAERTALARRAASLAADLVDLMRSRRPDWGFPLLAGMARLLALEASLASGALVLLDTFPDDAQRLEPAAWAGYDGAFDALIEERRDDLRRARTELLAGDARSELAWSRVEMAGNLLFELARARSERSAARVHGERLVPARAAWRSDWPRPALAGDELARELDAARRRAGDYRTAMHDLYGYDLVARNCATELLREIAAATETRESPRVDPDGPLTFIPFVAAREVAAGGPVVASWVEPSYRQLAVARASQRGARAVLRETNVLTSSVYRWHSADPLFVVFSDDTTWMRPLVGGVNLAVATGATAAGLLRLPFDGGELLRDAVSGVVYSLPELAFVSIRKGTFPIAPLGWLPERSPSLAAD